MHQILNGSTTYPHTCTNTHIPTHAHTHTHTNTPAEKGEGNIKV